MPATPERRLSRIRFGAALYVALGLPVVAAALGRDATAPAHIEVRLDAGLVTVQARDAALVDVVRAVGEQAGFETIVTGRITSRVSSSFTRLPVTEALQRLLSGVDYVAINAPVDERGVAPVVWQLWLLGMSAERADDPVDVAGGRTPDRAPADASGKARSEELLRLTLEGPTQEVLDTLGAALRADQDPLVRTRAAMALGKLGDERALAALEHALGDEHSSVRLQAVQALSQIDSEAATALLGEVLLDSGGGTNQRIVAAWGLWRHDTAAARAFLAAAAEDPDARVRRAATRSPGAVGEAGRGQTSATGQRDLGSHHQ